MIARTCWCKSENLVYFSSEYKVCLDCQTLVSQAGLTNENLLVEDDALDFYGKKYWLSHQQIDLKYPNIFERSVNDLPERCLHWLRTTLKYQLPKGNLRALELGCCHGGFVFLLKQLGYCAKGLELSEWVVNYAKETFHIDVYHGPLETQSIPKNSLDIIFLMDVFEHLPEPEKTLGHILTLLKTDGLLIFQLPCYIENKTYEEMIQEKSYFLEQLKSDEHLYLYSKSAIQKLFHQFNINHIQFENAIFFQYDMFLVASRSPLKINSPEEIQQFLAQSPETRLIQAMLNLYERNNEIARLWQESELDRSARLDVIHRQQEMLNKYKRQVIIL